MVGNSLASIAFRLIVAGLKRDGAYPVSPLDGDALRSLAPHLFILDMAGAAPVYRLAGSAVRAAFGADPCGRSYYENWNSAARAALRPFFQASLEAGDAFHLFSDALRPPGRWVRYGSVLTPIRLGAAKHCFVGITLLLEGELGTSLPAMEQHLEHIAFLRPGSPPAAEKLSPLVLVWSRGGP